MPVEARWPEKGCRSQRKPRKCVRPGPLRSGAGGAHGAAEEPAFGVALLAQPARKRTPGGEGSLALALGRSGCNGSLGSLARHLPGGRELLRRLAKRRRNVNLGNLRLNLLGRRPSPARGLDLLPRRRERRNITLRPARRKRRAPLRWRQGVPAGMARLLPQRLLGVLLRCFSLPRENMDDTSLGLLRRPF